MRSPCSASRTTVARRIPGAVDRIAADLDRLFALWRDDAGFRAFVADPRLDARRSSAAPSPSSSAPASATRSATWSA